MFKSNLGLGLGSTKKSDLNQYLKTLEKKNKEVQRKFSVTDGDIKTEENDQVKDDSAEDSDLLSIQKEFEDEFDSPFIKKKVERRPSAIDEIPDEVPFISSLSAPRTASGAGVGNALNSFMKYDKKWRGGKEGPKVSVKVESDTESEPVITENSNCSPLKIAEELEEKTFPHRRRRKSSGSMAAKAGATPSPRSRSAKSEHEGGSKSRLRLNVGGLAGRKVSYNDSQGTPIPTAPLSELSEPFQSLSPRSPLLDILNLRDISEVIDENDNEGDNTNDDESGEQLDSDGFSKRLSGLILNVDSQKDDEIKPGEKEDTRKETELKSKNGHAKNPFHFNSTKLKSSIEKSDSEPKTNVLKTGSNKKRQEILDSTSNSLAEKFLEPHELLHSAEDESESETLKKDTEPEKKTRKKWKLDSVHDQQPMFEFPKQRISKESSFESDCYYCRKTCRRHQSLLKIENCHPPPPPQYYSPKRATKVFKDEYPATSEVGVQVGKTTIHHYLFDPTEDALFDNTFHHQEYPRTEISGHKLDLATSSVIELMRKQLELTEHQMRSQKALYRSFCKSLEKSQRKLNKNDKHEKVLFGRSKRPEKLTFEEALRQVREEMKQEKEDSLENYSVSKLSKRKSKSNSRHKSSHSLKNQSMKNADVKEVLPSNQHIEDEDESVSKTITEEVYDQDFEDDSEIHTEIAQSSKSSARS